MASSAADHTRTLSTLTNDALQTELQRATKWLARLQAEQLARSSEQWVLPASAVQATLDAGDRVIVFADTASSYTNVKSSLTKTFCVFFDYTLGGYKFRDLGRLVFSRSAEGFEDDEDGFYQAVAQGLPKGSQANNGRFVVWAAGVKIGFDVHALEQRVRASTKVEDLCLEDAVYDDGECGGPACTSLSVALLTPTTLRQPPVSWWIVQPDKVEEALDQGISVMVFATKDIRGFRNIAATHRMTVNVGVRVQVASVDPVELVSVELVEASSLEPTYCCDEGDDIYGFLCNGPVPGGTGETWEEVWALANMGRIGFTQQGLLEEATRTLKADLDFEIDAETKTGSALWPVDVITVVPYSPRERGRKRARGL